MRRITGKTVAVACVILGIAIAIAATQVSFLQGSLPGSSNRNDPAPDFEGIAGWLNSPPLTLRSLSGKVVLVDFWAYSCINCIRTFPALRALYARYKPVGLEIVGVHSPEFSFEKHRHNVRTAIARNSLTWPVALDNEMDTWRAYKNNYWPHVYLIDTRGRIRFDHIGEGGHDRIESTIRGLLQEAHATLPAPVNVDEPTGSAPLTREIYAGYERGTYEGSIGNPEGYNVLNKVVDYRAVDPKTIAGAGTDGLLFLEGRWIARPEYLEAAEDGARLVLPYAARDVFMVAASTRPVEVTIALDGETVPAAALGADAPGGVVRVSRSDLYRLLKLDTRAEHRLTLVAGKGFRLYTFTFG